MPGEPLILLMETAAHFGFCLGPEGRETAPFSWNASLAEGLLIDPGCQPGAGWQGAALQV